VVDPNRRKYGREELNQFAADIAVAMKRSNQASEATSEPAPGAGSSSPQG
jgi:hypothetical protein